MNTPHADTDSHVIALIRSRRLLEADPQNATAHFEQGNALCQLGQSAEAVASWTQAVTLEPSNAFAYINIGIVYLQREQWAEAEQAFHKAVELQPERAEAHYGLGMAYARQGQHEAAQLAWQETLRFAPEHAEARANLAVLMERHAPQEVFSINLGPAQTLQIECVILPEDQPLDLFSTRHALTSSVHSASSLEQASDTQELPVSPQLPVEMPQLSTEKPRIKLPELKGPPLESIAGAVLAAHDARIPAASLPECETSPDGQTSSVASYQEQDTPEPTLKFDSEDLKKEHSRLRRRQSAGSSLRSRRNMAAAVGAAFLIILLTFWNLQSRRSQSVPPSFSVSPGASLARASTSLPAPYSEQPLPALQHDLTDAQHGRVASKQFKPALPRAVVSPTLPVSRSPRTDLHARTVEQEPHLKREQRAISKAAVPRIAHRRVVLLARPVHATSVVHPAKSRHDEDTFPVHAQTTHNEAADEWTDHIPK